MGASLHTTHLDLKYIGNYVDSFNIPARQSPHLPIVNPSFPRAVFSGDRTWLTYQLPL
jgi:hypothetical protein